MERIMRLKGNNVMYFVPNFTVIDMETTGRGNQYSEITEMSGIRYRNYQPVATFTTLVKAHNPILPFVSNLTGIDDKLIEDSPDISEVIEAFVEFLGDDLIVGHNVNFDLNLVYDAYYGTYLRHVRNDYTDTLHFARILVEDSENHKLKTLAEYFGIKRVNGHRGLPDCEQTGSLYVALKDRALKTHKIKVWE